MKFRCKKKVLTDRSGCMCCTQMASIRAEKTFTPCESDNPDDQVKPMLDWANGGFLPKGEEGLKPTHTAGEQKHHKLSIRNKLQTFEHLKFKV